MLAMVEEQRCLKRFRQDVGSHVIRRNPECIERSLGNVLTNEMMANIDVLCPRRYGIGVGNSAGALIVAENGKRFWRWNFGEG